jgi:Phage tail assembly chaperone proteins, E, or 41 or 14
MQEAVKQTAEAPAPVRLKEIVVNLTTPIQAHGETVKQMKFRRPTGGDIMAMGAGYPISINWQSGEITVNPPVMGEMMSLLAAVPPSSIKSMDAEDWATCAYALMRFFPPDVQGTQTQS